MQHHLAMTASSVLMAAVCSDSGVAGQPPIVRVGVPAASYRPWLDFTGGVQRDPHLFLPKLLRILSADMLTHFSFVPFNFTPSSLYDTVYGGLLNDDYDIAWVILHYGADPYNHPGVPRGSLVMTCPFVTDSMWVLIGKKRSRINLFRFLEPFHWQLWLAIVTCISLVAGLMVFIHKVAPLEEEHVRISLNYIGSALYHAWSAFLGGETFEWLTPSARVLHIAVLLLVLITSATYTANLAAFFTKPSFQLIGPQTLEEAKQSTLCMTYSTGVDRLQPFAREVVCPPDDMTLEYRPRAEWCRDQIHRGHADAYVEMSSIAQSFLLENCDYMARPTTVEFSPLMSVFVLKSNKLDLQAALTSAILGLMASPDYQGLQRTVLSMGRSCGDETADSDTEEVTLEQMRGFFLIFGLVALLSVLVAAFDAAKRKLRKGEEQEDKIGGLREGMTDAEMILQLSKKVDILLKEVPQLAAAHMESVSI